MHFITSNSRCINNQEVAIDIESEKAAIQLVIDEHMDAIDSVDVERLLAIQTDDHIDMPPNMPPVVGKEAYRDYFTPYVAFFESLKDERMVFDVVEFVVSGDWAFQIGTYHVKYIFQDDSEMKDQGNYVWFFKKDTDGNWKWARIISNSTLPMPVSE